MSNIFFLSYSRRALLVAAVGSLSLIAAVVLQHVLGWQPCPLCILQRIAVMGLVVFAGLSAVLPGSPVTALVTRLLASAAALGGMYAAYEQLGLIWGQLQASCGLGLRLLLLRMSDYLPALSWLLEGPADCASEANTLLGMPLAVWVMSLLAGSLIVLWLPSRTPQQVPTL